jgi:hypothetical protein
LGNIRSHFLIPAAEINKASYWVKKFIETDVELIFCQGGKYKSSTLDGAADNLIS